MQRIKLTFFSLLFLLIATDIFAQSSTTLTVNYPAPSGSYNKVTLQNLQALPDCTQANNVGLLFINTNTNNLELCANGVAQSVPYPEACFNQFCSCVAGTCTGCPVGGFTSDPCPTGFTQGKISVNGANPQPINDSYKSSAYTIYSTVCCSGNILPTN